MKVYLTEDVAFGCLSICLDDSYLPTLTPRHKINMTLRCVHHKSLYKSTFTFTFTLPSSKIEDKFRFLTPVKIRESWLNV